LEINKLMTRYSDDTLIIPAPCFDLLDSNVDEVEFNFNTDELPPWWWVYYYYGGPIDWNQYTVNGEDFYVTDSVYYDAYDNGLNYFVGESDYDYLMDCC